MIPDHIKLIIGLIIGGLLITITGYIANRIGSPKE
jgi:hypothetical protein